MLFRPFFFQAEDGIRVFHVTGVQTCALPISSCWPAAAETARSRRAVRRRRRRRWASTRLRRRDRKSVVVGKECRCRWSANHEKTEKYQEAMQGDRGREELTHSAPEVDYRSGG